MALSPSPAVADAAPAVLEASAVSEPMAIPERPESEATSIPNVEPDVAFPIKPDAVVEPASAVEVPLTLLEEAERPKLALPAIEPMPPISMRPPERSAPLMVVLIASASALPAVVVASAELLMPAIPETEASLAMLRPASRLRPFAVFRLLLPRAAPVTLLPAAEEPKST